MIPFDLNEEDLEIVKTHKVKLKGRKNPTKLNILTLKVEYDNDIFYVNNKDIKYNILNLKDCRKVATKIYTTPLNDRYPNWTEKDIIPHLPSRYDIAIQFWSPFKPGMKLKIMMLTF